MRLRGRARKIRLVHHEGHSQPREKRQGGDRVAEVAPEPIDAKRAGAPSWMRGIGDGCDQARVDHRRAEAEQKAADDSPLELVRRRGEKQTDRLNLRAGDDQALAPPAVAQGLWQSAGCPQVAG